MSENGLIIERGRGPEIAGTRITVFDVLDYLLAGWQDTRIADFFKITPDQVRAAVAYIQDNKLQVMADYTRILERCARGNPPELQARLDETHQRFQRLMKKAARRKRGESRRNAFTP